MARGKSRPLRLAAATAAALGLGASVAVGFGGFRAPDHYDVGGNPLNVAVGDVTGDGRADLATADDDGVSVLRARRNGAFRDALIHPSDQPNDLVLARFDDDAALDVAVAGGIGGTYKASVALGQGDGTFQPSADPDYELGTSYASAIEAGDFDRDGARDLAVGTYNAPSAGELWVLLGNGDGTFQTPVDYETGGYIDGIAVTKLNGDRHPDLAVVPGDPCGVHVLTGVGDGTFDPAEPHELTSCPSAVVAGDFAGDGKTDLATANLSETMSVLRGREDADLAAPDTYDVGDEVFDLAAGDYDRDGRVDFAVPDRQNDEVVLLRGKRGGGFRRAGAEPAGDGAIAIVAARLNGDRGIDLATSNQTGEDVSVLLNKP
jgi:FG-GAP-like repeat